MFKSFTSFLVALVISLIAIGCGPNKEAQLEGKWKFASVDLGSAASSPQAQAAVKAIKDSSPTIEFKPDKHFVVAGSQDIEGTWALKENTVTLTMTTFQGKSVEDLKKQIEDLKAKYPNMAGSLSKMDPSAPQTGTLSEDGKNLTISSPSTGGRTVFSKA